MTALKRREVIRLIPAEVLRRVRKGGLGEPDWYAGRHAPVLVISELGITPGSLRAEIRAVRSRRQRTIYLKMRAFIRR